MSLQIQNIVGTGNLGIEIDIPVLWEDIEAYQVTYEPENYHGLYVRLEEDGPLVTVYRTGKYIVTGAHSKSILWGTKDRFLQLLVDMEVIDRPKDESFGVNNVVCTSDLGHTVDLNRLVVSLGLENTEYEPEQFPGLVYRPGNYSCIILVFSSGRCVVTGAPTKDMAAEAFECLQERIETNILE